MRERALEKLKRVEIAIKKIRDNTPPTLDQYLDAGIVKDGIMKNLEEAIQNLLDVCAIVIKEDDLGIPAEEAGYIDILVKAKKIDAGAGSNFQRLRGLRNRLVHAYGEIDDQIIYENITERLTDFDNLIQNLRKIC